MAKEQTSFDVEILEERTVYLVCSECGEELAIEKVDEPTYRSTDYTVHVKPHQCPKEE